MGFRVWRSGSSGKAPNSKCEPKLKILVPYQKAMGFHYDISYMNIMYLVVFAPSITLPYFPSY
jgi:hypothetical protein